MLIRRFSSITVTAQDMHGAAAGPVIASRTQRNGARRHLPHAPCGSGPAAANPPTRGTASVRSATGQAPAARAAYRVLLAVTSAALAAGVVASTASTATASVTRPAASTGAPLPGAPP